MATTETLDALPGSAYRALPRTPETWIVENLIPASGLFNLFGPSKAGKSYGALQLAVDVSSGSPDWLTFPIHSHGPVLYVQLDTPRSLWGARLDTIATELGLDDSNVYYADANMAPYPFDILREETILTESGRIVKHPCQDWLQRQVEKVHPVLVILDTLREFHRGDENDSGQMVNVMSALVHATTPAALCLISHSRKDNMSVPESERDNLLQDNRGSNYIAGRMDGIMKITPKRITYQSRTIDRHYLKCKRTQQGLWAVDASEESAQIRAILADASLTSLTARAEALSAMTGKTLEASRSALRRHLERSGGLSEAAPSEA